MGIFLCSWNMMCYHMFKYSGRSNIAIAEWIGRRFWESRQFYSAYIALFIIKLDNNSVQATS
jgi:hypothetical protein